MSRPAVALAVVLLAAALAPPAATAQRDAAAPQPGRQGAVGPQGRQGGGGRLAGAGRQGRGGQGEALAGTASIRGRVTAADTGSPVRRAQVRAQGPVSRLAMTDVNGRFEFTGLPAGQWTITAAKAGYVSLRFGQRRPAEIVPPIALKEGERASADIALPRGSAIVGRITDEFGDPIAGVRVQVLSYRTSQARGQRRLAPVGVSAQTDDTGAFRVYGLGPGEYYVSARADSSALETAEGASTFAPTYFPGTATLDEAQRVPVGVGDEANASFQLLLVRTVRVSGTVVDSTGAPLGDGAVILAGGFESADGGAFAPGATTRVRGDGTFVLTNVVPGSYTLQVATGGRGRGNAGVTEVGYVPLVVGSADLTGVSVATTRGASVRGSVVAERGTGTAPTTGLRVGAQPLRPAPGLGARAAPVAADGTFSLTGLAGPQIFRVDGVPRDWMVARLELGGADVTDSTVEFTGAERAELRVVLTNRVPQITGTVTGSGRAGAGSHVVVFPSDAGKWTAPSRYLRTARTDAEGAFTIRGLPPYERYLAVAVDSLDDGEAGDPVFLEGVKESATSFSLREGEQKSLDLKLVERAQ
jgi:hypothetical protein